MRTTTLELRRGGAVTLKAGLEGEGRQIEIHPGGHALYVTLPELEAAAAAVAIQDLISGYGEGPWNARLALALEAACRHLERAAAILEGPTVDGADDLDEWVDNALSSVRFGLEDLDALMGSES